MTRTEADAESSIDAEHLVTQRTSPALPGVFYLLALPSPPTLGTVNGCVVSHL